MRLPLIGALALATVAYASAQERPEIGKYFANPKDSASDMCNVSGYVRMSRSPTEFTDFPIIACEYVADGRRTSTTSFGNRLQMFTYQGRGVIVVTQRHYDFNKRVDVKMDGYAIDTSLIVDRWEKKHNEVAERVIKPGNLVKEGRD